MSRPRSDVATTAFRRRGNNNTLSVESGEIDGIVKIIACYRKKNYKRNRTAKKKLYVQSVSFLSLKIYGRNVAWRKRETRAVNEVEKENREHSKYSNIERCSRFRGKTQ